MKIPTPTAIAQCAEALWLERGRPTGIDIEIWLEAERRLTGEATRDTDAAAAKAAQRTKKARSPVRPTTTAPRPATPESGKPLWSKPHSS